MLDKYFWDNRYKNDQTGWDIGSISTPLKEFFDTLDDKELTILIPGCGRAYEAEYLFLNGFKNITVIDLSPTALNEFSERLLDFPKNHLICNDFFKHNGSYDLIIEQTFFCALDKILRTNYVKHTSQLLNEGGKLVGLLFAEEFGNDHPPFGGTKKEYLNLFSKNYTIEQMEIAKNSIAARKGREFFISFKNKIA